MAALRCAGLCFNISDVLVVFVVWKCGGLRDDSLRNSELTSKLEPAFLGGLRCSQPHLRQKFMEVFDASIRRRLFDRLMYIISSQNWESMAGHFWIKQCVEVRHRNRISGFPIFCVVISVRALLKEMSFYLSEFSLNVSC